MISLENQSEKYSKNRIQDIGNRKNEDAKISKFMEFKNIDEAMEAAVYYGFSPVEAPTVEKIDFDRAAGLIEEESAPKDRIVSRPIETSLEEKNFFLRYYAEKNLIAEPQPIMFSYRNANSSNKSDKQKKSADKGQSLNLQIFGSSKSVTEVILIKTALALLSDKGIEDVCVGINSIGDKESTNKFVRELANYYRKNINKMSPHCRQLFKKDSFSLLECDKQDCCGSLNEEAPKAISFLSEPSRQHFKEVLEGLEILNISYRINNNLIPDRWHSSHTIFEITAGGAENKKEIIASGGRYDGLAKKIGLRKDIPAIGIKISSKKIGGAPIRSKIKTPGFFFLQLGFEAKLKGLNIIEMLRKAKILVQQSLSRDMLGGQIALAEKMKMPYALIMGKKESMENTVMVRDMNTRSQETVPVGNLSAYLKKLRGRF